MHRFKVFAMALIMVAAFGISGCGGGGGGGGTTDTTEPPVTDPAIAQRAAIKSAIDTAETAVEAVDNDSTAGEVTAADTAITAARGAITAAADVPAEEKAANTGTVNALASRLTAAKTARQAAMDAAADAANMAMAATAAKLYAGIGATPLTGHTVTIGTDGALSVDPEGVLGNQALTEDKKTPVADNHGWQGKRYTASGTDVTGTYEAVVYSNVGEATEGDPFNEEYSDNFADGTLAETITEGTASRVASPSFDQSAGVKAFKLPTNDGTNPTSITPIAGSYHGVSGYYHCTPGGADNTCAVNVAAQGFTLGGVDANNAFTAGNSVWTFKPSDPNAKVMSVNDMIYVSYGWWLHKAADDGDFTASAFHGERGNVPDATGITALRGTATYMGGAAGKYALRSSTGGTNDAGHFTARATLEADFNDDMITGTIDNFMGADGKSRDWSVELMEQGIGDTGIILGDDGTGTAKMTKWTIDGTAGSAGGQWSGSLQDNGADSVPKVGSGTFHSTYGGDGRMVGAFGVNKQ